MILLVSNVDSKRYPSGVTRAILLSELHQALQANVNTIIRKPAGHALSLLSLLCRRYMPDEPFQKLATRHIRVVTFVCCWSYHSIVSFLCVCRGGGNVCGGL